MQSRPLFEEGTALYARNRELNRVPMLVTGILAFLTFILWPDNAFIAYFSYRDAPTVLRVVLTLAAPGLVIANGLLGSDAIAREEFIAIEEWLWRSGLPRFTVAWGKSAVSAIHTLLLVLLAAPVIVLAAVPLGVSYGELLYDLAILASSSLIARFGGLLALALFHRRVWLVSLFTWMFLMCLLFITLLIEPLLNPFVALLAEAGEDAGWYAGAFAPRHARMALLYQLLTALLLCIAACCAILSVRDRNRTD
jgi:hypothetical protein